MRFAIGCAARPGTPQRTMQGLRAGWSGRVRAKRSILHVGDRACVHTSADSVELPRWMRTGANPSLR